MYKSDLNPYQILIESVRSILSKTNLVQYLLYLDSMF
jgi:hypothetical protein